MRTRNNKAAPHSKDKTVGAVKYRSPADTGRLILLSQDGKVKGGAWWILLLILIGAFLQRRIKAAGYTDANAFFEDLLSVIITWSWLLIIPVLLLIFFRKEEKKPQTEPEATPTSSYQRKL